MSASFEPYYFGIQQPCWSLHVIATSGKRFTYRADDIVLAENARDRHLADGLCAWVTTRQSEAS